ncbi:glycoside hydrolase family 95 protein [Muricauda sp. SCSIO 64092]|uniref:glycoside hydrolase family 95 protein n=1 Tax=Allomuricauda sp. SCSIO 64092 TaxID=2908842 RepID=UPI001FF4367C|nr:glycoside hydrolase family 95 protein [Muricauda sp. SCSIO 64092]UOY04942.1 glycoside hydrolase family 95 protein [Muricauda sp. SCSIO 64092]
MPYILIKNKKRRYLIRVLFLFLTTTSIYASDKDSLTLWYRQPAQIWDEALPIGNGRLGAMVFGGVTTERLQLNEESIWSKGDEYKDKPGGYRYVKKIRNLLFQGRYQEAEKMAMEKLMGERLPSGTNTYQTLGDLHINFEGVDNYSNYYRDLNLSRAMATTRFTSENVQHQRTVFSTAKDQAIVMHATASQSGNITATLVLSRPDEGEVVTATDNRIILKHHLNHGRGVQFEARVVVIIDGGTLKVEGQQLKVNKANSMEIRIVAGTDYFKGNPATICDTYEQSLKSRSYQNILQDHITDYQRLFNRVRIELPATEAAKFATDERIAAQANGAYDPSLAALYFQFGRYLLISSSRKGNLPANLQGIWADGIAPPWNSDYHININIQMMYWPAEITNLSECHIPFLEFIGKLRENGRKTAKELYGAKGFTAHHTTDVWHFTTSFGLPRYGLWPMGAAWSATHIWEHYLFTEDKTFLANYGYPVMREAAEFLSSFLVKHPKTGKLVTGPSMSPENVFVAPSGEKASIVMGPAMDLQITRHLFESVISASEVLNTDKAFRNKLKTQLARLTPSMIGKDGLILEWSSEELKQALPGHRHISHLYGLFPSGEFNWNDTPEYMTASKKVIEDRLSKGGGHTGWSRGWIMNFYARLLDGNKVWDNLTDLWAKKTYPNLFDAHPPFQMDGNMGSIAALVEALLQSYANEINLLPALPDALPSGKISGLVARGGFIVDIEWDNYQLLKATITSKLGNNARIRYGSKVVTFKMGKGESITLDKTFKYQEDE